MELTGEGPGPEVAAHLETCRECREAAQVVGWAALPKVSAAERAPLVDLPRRAVEVARREERWHRPRWNQLVQLTLAASLGATVAATALMNREPAPERVVLEVPIEVPALPEVDEPNFSDDEVFFEVSWPDVNVTSTNGVDP